MLEYFFAWWAILNCLPKDVPGGGLPGLKRAMVGCGVITKHNVIAMIVGSISTGGMMIYVCIKLLSFALSGYTKDSVEFLLLNMKYPVFRWKAENLSSVSMLIEVLSTYPNMWEKVFNSENLKAYP